MFGDQITMTFAFAPSVSFPCTTASKPAICTYAGFRKVETTTTTLSDNIASNDTFALSDITPMMMSCRRNLKKEKHQRNLQFARAHRKRVVKYFNRRAAQEAIANEDNEFLSSLYGTIRFRKEKEEKSY